MGDRVEVLVFMPIVLVVLIAINGIRKMFRHIGNLEETLQQSEDTMADQVSPKSHGTE